MERDFMGLISKDSAVSVKEEEVVEESSKDSGYGGRSSGVAWPLAHKASAFRQVTSFKSDQDEKPPKNLGGTSMKQQFLGGSPLADSHSVLPSSATLAGTTEKWFNSKASIIPSQLTIFYAGTVHVFDEISPEQAQAIMFLAGTRCGSSKMAQAPVTKPTPAEPTVANVRLGSGLPSPISVSSHPTDQSSIMAANDNDVKIPSTIGMATTLANKVEPPKMVSSLGSVAATAMMSSAVPQSRKASLARFLEKRKERAMNAAPYNLCKKADESPTLESNGSGFSATSSMSTSKETTAGN